MTTEVHAHSSANLDLFRKEVVTALRLAGRLQRELAHAVGINPQVLSRKLHGVKQAFPTHREVMHIIKTLAAWDAITSQLDAIKLLAAMGLKTDSFSNEEWSSPPLNRLEPVPHNNTPNTTLPHSPLPTAFISSLPTPCTPLLGREQHVQMLLKHLQQPHIRLLTLLGTGGVGKTRLALEIAHIARSDFADGAFFVPLATLHDVTLLPSTLVQVLHLTEPLANEEPGRQNLSSQEHILKTFLYDKKLLLILDNVEQIPAITPFISDLLSNAPSLKIMVTSRTVLRLYGEYEFDVPALEVGLPDQATDLATISQLSAIRLFVERAQAVNPTFHITQQNATTIAHICARLDGLPLAIELAAARTKVLPLPAILQRLSSNTGQNLTFLHSTAYNTLQRHQTLYETLAWSYELLNPPQQLLFRRLCIFPGRWTAQAALTICMAEDHTATLDDALTQIEILIDHSLVKRIQFAEETLEPCFHFLEIIRDYGLGQLKSQGEHTALQQRHATYYLALAESLMPDLAGNQQIIAVSTLAHEQDNMRAALTWAREQNKAEIAQRLCGALSKFWEARTQFHEAHLWIDSALKMTQETAPTVRANLLMAASRLALWEIAYEHSRALAQEALTLYESIDDQEGKAMAIFQIGDTWHMQGAYAQATTYLEESLHLLHAQKNWGNYAFTLSRLGAIAILQSDFPLAWNRLQEALPLMRAYSEPNLFNVTLVYLGVLALVQGDLKQSMLYLHEGLLFAQHIDNRYTLATDLIAFGCLLGIIQGPSYAAQICSAAETLFASLNTALPSAYQPLYAAYLGGLKSQVDDTVWQAWWAEGQSLSQAEICNLVLTVSEAALQNL
jgi:predicted ATPase